MSDQQDRHASDWQRHVRQHLSLERLTAEREHEIVEEIASLLEQAYTEALDAGFSAKEARARALRHVEEWDELGQRIQSSERRHQVASDARLQDGLDRRSATASGSVWRPLAELFGDLRQAVRGIRSSPGFATMVVVLLALGVGANAAIFTVARSVLLSPLPYDNAERLVAIWQDLENRGVTHYPSAPADLVDYRGLDAFEEVAGMFSFDQSLVGDDGRARKIRMAVTSTNLDEVLGVDAVVGRLFGDEDGVPSPPPAEGEPPTTTLVVLAHSTWQNQFGGRDDIVGQELRFGFGSAQVIGVLPAGFRLLLNPTQGHTQPVDAYLPYQVDWANAPRNSWFLVTLGLLKDGASVADAQGQLSALEASWWEDFPVNANAGTRIRVEPLHRDLVAHVSPALWTLTGAALLVLLIASVNIGGLLIVRMARRSRELSIRAALGSGQRRLVRLLLVEGVVLAVFGALMALLVAQGGLRVLLRLVPAELPQLGNIEIDAPVALLTLVVCVLCALAASLWPALEITAVGVGRRAGGLLGGVSSRTVTAGRGPLFSGLVATQLALSVLLLIGAGLAGRSLLVLLDEDLGFRAEGVLSFETSVPQRRYDSAEKRRALHEQLRRDLAALPGVTEVGAVDSLPLSGSGNQGPYGGERELEDNDESDLRQAHWRSVAPGYFDAVGTTLLAGRLFDAADEVIDPEARPKVLVDRVLVEKSWQGRNPIGELLYIKNAVPPVWAEVVGVVDQQRQARPYGDEQETIYFPGATNNNTLFWTVRTQGDELAHVPTVRELVREVDPEITLSQIEPLSAVVDRAHSPARFLATLIGLFSVVACVLAICGLWGVLTQSVRQQTRELGIRMALGAGRQRVLGSVLQRGLLLTSAGLVAGLLASIPARRLIDSQLVGVDVLDPIAYLAAAAVFVVVAAAACLGPAARASRIDPAVVLRSDS